MKIRSMDVVSAQLICEECKEKGKEGVFLTLGFFNGFICTDCGWKLSAQLNAQLVGIPNFVEEPTRQRIEFKKYSPDTPGNATIDHTATSEGNWMHNVIQRLEELEKTVSEIRARFHPNWWENKA